MIIQIEIQPSLVKAVVNALRALVPISNIRVFEPVDIPAEEDVDPAMEALALRVADATERFAKRGHDWEAVRQRLTGVDTGIDQEGESDSWVRNAMARWSKAVKPVLPGYSPPLEALAHGTKSFFQNGSYKGTKYQVTRLGLEVAKILRQRGHIG